MEYNTLIGGRTATVSRIFDEQKEISLFMIYWQDNSTVDYLKKEKGVWQTETFLTPDELKIYGLAIEELFFH